MSLCRKLIAALFFFIALINVGKASESEVLLNKADVCFDVRKLQDTVLITGKENGQEKFSTTISSASF